MNPTSLHPVRRLRAVDAAQLQSLAELLIDLSLIHI